MRLNCYQCKTDTLEPALLDGSLEALKCITCNGVHVYLSAYREWLEAQTLKNSNNLRAEGSEVADNFDFTEVENTDGALICQGCGKYTLKYLIDNEHENTINVCHSCNDIWLDRGEWQLLKYLKMQNALTEVISDPWQKRLKAEERENNFKLLYQQKLGNDFAKAEEFAQWLVTRSNKNEILHYLKERKL